MTVITFDDNLITGNKTIDEQKIRSLLIGLAVCECM